MHPNITSDKPGTCSICGMNLVPKQEISGIATKHRFEDRGLGPKTWKNYLPLIAIIAIITCSASIIHVTRHGGGIEAFMIGFFLVFGGFKLLDPKGFAEGYAMYDLLAQKVPAYGYVYPYIELGFGFLMLAGIVSPAILWLEIVVMVFSGAGVVRKMLKREIIQCVCLGTVLKVPLTYVTLVEDFGMAALAGILLFLG